MTNSIAEKRENRRVRITRQALRDSLLEMLHDRPINQITVTELCKRADTNRSTFYLYYKDAYDLLEQIEDELYAQLEQAVSQSDIVLPTTEILSATYEVVYKNRDLCQVLFGKHGSREFMERITQFQQERVLHYWQASYPKLPANVLEQMFAFSVGASLSLIIYWVQNNFRETPKQLAENASKLMQSGIMGLAGL